MITHFLMVIQAPLYFGYRRFLNNLFDTGSHRRDDTVLLSRDEHHGLVDPFGPQGI
jgi:hypothetical protein